MSDLLARLSAAIAQLKLTLNLYNTMQEKIYNVAAGDLHKQITLNSSVPPDVGCAEAVSYVLKQAGVSGIPAQGFASTSDLYHWMLNSTQFVATTEPQAGDIVISPTGTSSINTPHGHTGIVAKQGILSNDSDTGLFLEKYTLSSWKQYFGATLGFPVYYFRCF